MIRLKDILLGSLLALALFVPGLAKADPAIGERPHLSDMIEGSGPDLVFIMLDQPAQFDAALDTFLKS